jgi:hypothetical protein
MMNGEKAVVFVVLSRRRERGEKPGNLDAEAAGVSSVNTSTNI